MSVGLQPSTASVGEQFKLNRPGRIRLSYNYSYSDTDNFYFHEARQRNVERATLATSLLNEHLVTLEVDITERFSLLVEAPFIHARQTRSGPGSLAVNGAMVSTGIADIRIGARLWLLGVEDDRLRLYALAGVRLPTGEARERFTSEAGRRINKDVSVQPGTGNAAGFLELGGSIAIDEDALVSAFFQARYYFTPATNAASRNFRNELSGNGYTNNSDNDSAIWKIGAVASIGRAIREAVQDQPVEKVDGIGLSVAFVGAHVPYDDIIGGDSGFRRAANLFFFEPGLVWQFNEYFTLTASVPISVYKYVFKNGGNVPEFLFQAGITITLN